MHWLIQTNLFREDGHERLLSALWRLGVPFMLVEVRPFTDALFVPGTDTEIELPAGPVWVMGSYKLVRISRGHGLLPGAFLGGLDARSTRDLWGPSWLQYGAIFEHLRELSPLPWPRFVRPVYDSKSFAGRVFTPEEFAEFQSEACARTGEDDRVHGGTEVIVSTPRVIYSETRCWVVNGEVVTSSLYKRLGRPHFEEGWPSEQVESFARWRGRDRPHPNPAYVLDIADTPEGPKVIETNCLNAAGFYAADMQKLVNAIEEAHRHGYL
jgi:hypothetical protein